MLVFIVLQCFDAVGWVVLYCIVIEMQYKWLKYVFKIHFMYFVNLTQVIYIL